MGCPNGSLLQCIIGDILRNIPVGFAKYKTRQASEVLDKAFENIHLYNDTKELLDELDAAYLQVGTLGGGNHFIELQEDEKGHLCLMIHSGSRHLGNEVCNHFHNNTAHTSIDVQHIPITTYTKVSNSLVVPLTYQLVYRLFLDKL